MDAGTEKSLPRPGLVSQIRQNWSVFEDSALAQQMQQQEISRHLHGNRQRNQILRGDIPQARAEQSLEEVQASLEYSQYRRRLDEVAVRDAELAEQLGRKQEFRSTSDAQYIAQRDEAFAKNLQRIEREYREKQSRAPGAEPSQPRPQSRASPAPAPAPGPRDTRDRHVSPAHSRDVSYHELGGGLQYHEEQYQVQVARLAQVTEEPLYMNNVGQEAARASPLLPPTPFRGQGDLGQQHGEAASHSSYSDFTRDLHPDPGDLRLDPRDSGHNISSEFSGGRSSQSSTRSRSSLASTSPSELLGAAGGVAAAPRPAPAPGDVLGIGAALSPAEIRAAEAAERMLEQERKDMEIARQLQEQFSLTEDDHSDRKMAIEAQDHEFAKILHAKEKAKAKRAREKARQRKVERERQQRQESEDPDLISCAPEPQEADCSLSPRSAASPVSPDIRPPSRRPVIHEGAIDSHVNDTYCTRQITPAQSQSESEESEPRYANIRRNGEPVMEEPILAIKKSKKSKAEPSVPLEDIPAPPYMPMQSSTSKKSASLERRIKKKKEKEGCKQQ